MTATLLCWNVNSLTTTAKSLATFSRNSHPQIPDKSHPLINLFTAYQADIICFQETKLSTKTLANAKQHVCIPGYTSFHTLSKKPGYSGVATYVKNGKTKCAVAGYESEWFNDEEGRVMITDHGIFVLINLYVPNAGRGGDTLLYKMQFYESLKRYIRHLQEKGREIIICGDLNTAHGEIDIWNPAKFANSSGFLPEERAFLDSLESDLKLTDTYRYVNPTQRCYTFWDTRTCKREVNLGWRIDYFFVSEGLRSKITKAEILNDVFGSDHCPLLLCLDVELSRDYPTPANATSDSVMFKDTNMKLSHFFKPATLPVTSDMEKPATLPNTSAVGGVKKSDESQPGRSQKNEKRPRTPSVCEAASSSMRAPKRTKMENATSFRPKTPSAKRGRTAEFHKQKTDIASLLMNQSARRSP